METSSPYPLRIVKDWHEALNHWDSAAVLELSDPEIEIVGPRGSGYGRDLLRDWLQHARVSLTPLRFFCGGEAVVVSQHGTWHALETGDVIGEAGLASYFLVRDGRVVRYARYDRLDAALSAAGLTIADEVC